MDKTNLKIQSDSIWESFTPSDTARSLGFYVTEAGRFFAGPGYYTERDGREEYLILYTVSGRGRIRLADKNFPLPPGSAVLLDCRKYHYYAAEPQWDFIWMHINGGPVSAMFSLPDFSETPVPLPDKKEFVLRFNQLMEAAQKVDITALSQVSFCIHSILHLFAQGSLSGETTPAAAAVDYIKKHYMEPLSVEELAQQSNLSKYHFIRCFTRYTGVTPHQFLISTRINAAKPLLHSTGLSVNDVAEAVGFTEQCGFISSFRRHTGMTPAKYRKMYHNFKPDTP